MLPCDDTETDRLDVMHTMFLTARGEKLLNAPFQQRPITGFNSDRSRVLDLGCGTGIWMLDMAQRYKDTDFVGLDLCAQGPSTLLDNVEMRWPCDYESPWTLGEGSWDIIHLQMGLGSVANWPALYHKILIHLRRGVGWFEQVEIDLTPRCDDGTLAEGALKDWYGYLVGATQAGGRCFGYNPNTRNLLVEAGFTDIREEVFKLPLNGWPTDRKDHRVGLWYNIALSEGHQGTGGRGMEAMSLAPLTRHYRWRPDHVRRLCAEALMQVNDVKAHAYHELHIWSARSARADEMR